MIQLAAYPALGEGQAQVSVTASGTTSDIERIVQTLNRHHSRVFKATVISTLVVSIAALLNTWRLMKQLKHDEAAMRRTR